MAYDRPGNERSRPGGTVTRPDNRELDELHKITGISPEEAQSIKDRAVTDDMAEREGLSSRNGEDHDATDQQERNELDRTVGPNNGERASDDRADKSETAPDTDTSNDDIIGGGYRREKRPIKATLKGAVLNKKTAIVVGIAGGLTSIAIAFFAALPGFIGHTVNSLLLDKLGGVQHSHQTRYRRAKLAKISDVFSRDGRLGGKIIADMERVGYRFHFDRTPGNRNRIVGLTLPGGNASIPNIEGVDALADHIESYIETQRPLTRRKVWKTKRMEAFYTRYGVSRKSVVRPSVDDLENPSHTARRNIVASAYSAPGDDVSTRLPLDETIPDDLSDDEVAAINARRAEVRGVGTFEDMVTEGGDFTEAIQELSTTGTISDAEIQELVDIAPDMDIPVTQNVFDYAEKVTKGSVAGRVFNRIKGVALTTAVPDMMCIAHKRLKQATHAIRLSRAATLMRYGLDMAKISEDIKTGRVSSKTMGEVGKIFTSLDSNGNPLGGSPSYGYILRNKFSRSKNNIYKSSYGVDGKLTGVWGGIMGATNIRGCVLWQNPVFQIGLEVGIAVASFFSGGSAKAFATGTTQTVSQAVKKVITEGVKAVIKKETRKRIGRSIVRMVAVGAATNIALESVMALTQMYAEKSKAFNITGDEKGGNAFGKAAAGQGVAVKQRYLMAGQVPATVEQYEPVIAAYIAEEQAIQNNKSFYARIFDMSDVNSLASTITLSMPTNFSQLGLSLQKGISSIPSIITTGLASIFGGRAYAQDDDEISFDTYELGDGANEGTKLAVDPAGNLLPIMRQDIISIDPEENIEYLSTTEDDDGVTYISPTDLAPQSRVFVEHLENCVYEIDTLTKLEESDDLEVENDCLAHLDLTRRFKAHLAYLDMYDMLDAEFNPEDISPGESTNNGTIDCSNSVGNEKIVCAAQNYLGIRYSNNGTPALNGGADAEGWLNRNTTRESKSSAGIDCSGFTNLALYTAFNYKTTAGCSGGYVSGADPNIQEISLADLRPGDFLTVSRSCNSDSVSGHIGIFVRREADGTIVTLESSGGRNRDGQRVSGWYEKSSESLGGYWKYAARYVGPGSSQ